MNKLRFVRIRFISVLLWRHIIRCSYISSGQISCFIENFWDSKITEHDSSRSQENILSFDISMKNPPFMHIENWQSKLDDPIQNLFFTKFFLFRILYQIMHISTFTIGHDNIQRSFFINKRVSEWDNIRMLELLQ